MAKMPLSSCSSKLGNARVLGVPSWAKIHQKHHQPNHDGNAPGWTKFDPSKVHMEEVEMFHVFFW